VIMAGVLLITRKYKGDKPDSQTIIDIPSSVLSALGMSILVFGILQSKTWGWINPLVKPSIGSHEIAPLGISLVAWLILIGVLILRAFIKRQKMLEAEGRNPLLRVSMLSNPVLRSGLSVFMSQYFTIAALFFVIPVYLQTILGYDALKTGLKLIPLSIGLVLFSAIGSRLSAKRAARAITRWGQLAMAIGVLFVLGSIQPELKGALFWIGMFIVGAGFGLLASQLGNVNMSAVQKEDTSEVGGLQGTFQNLGTSMGTAVVGSIFMLMLTSGFTSAVQSSSELPQNSKEQITAKASEGIQIVSEDQVNQYIVSSGNSQATADSVSELYQQSQLKALKQGLFIVFVVSVLAMLLSKKLPDAVGAPAPAK
jgi:hypothetical protein